MIVVRAWLSQSAGPCSLCCLLLYIFQRPGTYHLRKVCLFAGYQSIEKLCNEHTPFLSYVPGRLRETVNSHTPARLTSDVCSVLCLLTSVFWSWETFFCLFLTDFRRPTSDFCSVLCLLPSVFWSWETSFCLFLADLGPLTYDVRLNPTSDVRRPTSDLRSPTSEFSLTRFEDSARVTELTEEERINFFIPASCSNEKVSRPCGEHVIHRHRLGWHLTSDIWGLTSDVWLLLCPLPSDLCILIVRDTLLTFLADVWPLTSDVRLNPTSDVRSPTSDICPPFSAHCSPFTVHHSLITVHFSLFTALQSIYLLTCLKRTIYRWKKSKIKFL